MAKEHLTGRIFDSRIKSEQVSRSERWLGYFIGPVSVMLMNSILNNYLNVYYTDVIRLGEIWGGWFLTAFPIVVKLIDAFTYVAMGAFMTRFHSPQGTARPWILLSAPLLCVSMILLFVVPDARETVVAVWIFFSYNLFYSVAFTAYNSAHTLMVPLATQDPEERSRLSVMKNMQGMISGMFVAVLFPTLIIPRIGVNKGLWVALMSGIAVIALPMISLEYFFTRERVTEENRRKQSQTQEPARTLSLREQIPYCLKSRMWVALMIYLVVTQLVNLLSHFSIFYYCNWVLGSYNDGRTQMLYYAIGNGVLGPGLFLCPPICRKLGRRNAMAGGYVLAALGTLLCFLNPTDLKLVLAGQVIKSIGLIPATFMVTAMLGDAMDDVRERTGVRCDTLSTAAVNVINTIATGLAMAALNLGITRLGYAAPVDGMALPVQSEAVKHFFVLCAVGFQTFIYPLAAAVLIFSPDERKKK